MMTPDEVRAIEEATRGWTYREWKMYVDRREEQYAAMRDNMTMSREDFASVERSVAAWNEWPCAADAPAQTRMGF